MKPAVIIQLTCYLLATIPILGGCSQPPADNPDAAIFGDGGLVCPPDGVHGPGRHRLFVQGHEADALDDGSYPFLHDHSLCDDNRFVLDCTTPPTTPPCECSNDDGVWQANECPAPLGPDELVHGEHFLVGPGAYAEFRTTLCQDITGEVALYIPNFDEPGSEALHQLFVVHGDDEFLIAEAIDSELGSMGYNPFIRELTGADPQVVPGDELLLRTTNLNGYQYSVMVWRPPSDYESWVLVTVP